MDNSGYYPTDQPSHSPDRPMSLRSLRRRWQPNWMSVEVRRRARDRVLRHFGLARTRRPAVAFARPEWMVNDLLQFVLAAEILERDDFTFLQIGAYDGTADTLRTFVERYQLRGVMVEPQPAAFARLRQTYCDQPQVTLLCAAIADEPGTRTLYVPRQRDATTASFDRQHLVRHGWSEADIEAREVPCHTVESALAAGGLDHVDFIQIDAEGYDAVILRSIDFTLLRPAIVRFEYRHLSPADADDCLGRLAAHGYRFLIDEQDVIACRDAGALDVVATAAA